MDAARRALEQYRRDLAALLSALDAGAQAEALAALEHSFSASFEQAARAMSAADAPSRDALAEELADLRRLATVSHARIREEHSRVAEDLNRVARARRVLRDAEFHETGDGCDARG